MDRPAIFGQIGSESSQAIQTSPTPATPYSKRPNHNAAKTKIQNDWEKYCICNLSVCELYVGVRVCEFVCLCVYRMYVRARACVCVFLFVCKVCICVYVCVWRKAVHERGKI